MIFSLLPIIIGGVAVNSLVKRTAFLEATSRKLRKNDIISGNTDDITTYAIYFANWLALQHDKSKELDDNFKEFLKERVENNDISKELAKYMEELLASRWNNYKGQLLGKSKEDLENYLLWSSMNNLKFSDYSCELLYSLALNFMAIEEGTNKEEKILDLHCDTGVFFSIATAFFKKTPYGIAKLAFPFFIDPIKIATALSSQYSKNTPISFHGQALTTESRCLSQMRATILKAQNENLKIEITSCPPWNKANKEKYDRIFLFPPIGEHPGEELIASKFANIYNLPGFPNIKPAMAVEMLWVARALSMLNDNGKLVAIVPTACLGNKANEPIRRYFLLKEWVEKVISLSFLSELRSATSFTMIVFSKKQNKEISTCDIRVDDPLVKDFKGGMMYLKKEVYQEGRRSQFENYTKRLVECITRLVENIEKTKEYHQINARDENEKCQLDARYYLMPEISFDKSQTKTFDKINIKPYRGNILTREEFREGKSDKSTKYRYITSASITQHGIVDYAQVPFLKEDFVKKYDNNGKKWVEAVEGDILITRSEPFKIAVVIKPPEHQQFYVSGNLYVLKKKDDEGKEDFGVYFLAKHLMSRRGIAQIEATASNGEMKIITPKTLSLIKIPSESPEEQRKSAEEFREVLVQIADLYEKLEEQGKRLDELSNEEPANKSS